MDRHFTMSVPTKLELEMEFVTGKTMMKTVTLMEVIAALIKLKLETAFVMRITRIKSATMMD